MVDSGWEKDRDPDWQRKELQDSRNIYRAALARARKPLQILSRMAVLSAAASALLGVLVNVLGTSGFERLLGRKAAPTVQEQIEPTFRALQKNSSEAVALLSQLQHEVNERQAALSRVRGELTGLEAQRRVLELSEEQRRAIAALVARPKTVWEIVMSSEFWFRLGSR